MNEDPKLRSEPIDVELGPDAHLLITESDSVDVDRFIELMKSVRVPSREPHRPVSPTGLDVAELATRPPQAYLTWLPVADAARYRVLRDGAPHELTRSPHTSYLDEFVTAGETYRYRVATVARDGAVSTPSDEVVLWMRPPPPPPDGSNHPPPQAVSDQGMPDFGWVPERGGPYYGYARYKLGFEDPVELPMLIAHRQSIMRGLTRETGLLYPSTQRSQRYAKCLSVSIPYARSMETLSSFEVRKGLEDFTVDLNRAGVALMLRLET